MAAERDAALERLDFLDRSTISDMRRRTASNAATIKRWRNRAEQAEARVAQLEALHEAHLRVEQRLAREQLAAAATVERVKNLRTIAPDGAQGPTWAALDLAIRDALDQPQQPTTTEQHADVQGRCPACGGDGLFLGSGGHVTCPRIGCPNPSAPDDLLNQRAHDWSTEQPTT